MKVALPIQESTEAVVSLWRTPVPNNPARTGESWIVSLPSPLAHRGPPENVTLAFGVSWRLNKILTLCPSTLPKDPG
jgi:hypothetical protein